MQYAYMHVCTCPVHVHEKTVMKLNICTSHLKVKPSSPDNITACSLTEKVFPPHEAHTLLNMQFVENANQTGTLSSNNCTRLWHYCIVVQFCRCKFPPINYLELFAEIFLQTVCLHVKSANVTNFSANKLCIWLKIRKI